MTSPKGFAGRLAQERRLKAAREERDIDNSDIALAVGTSDANVSKWFAGRTTPSDALMMKLADYFGVNPGWLRFGTEPRRPLAPDASRSGAELYYGEEVGVREEHRPVKKAANDRGKKR